MWLIGMMGSGKSTIGAIAADRLHVDFFDTDQMVTDQAGKSIAEIWDEMGEQGFRDLEREMVSSVPLHGALAAAGGGAVLDPGNRTAISASPPVIWLRARPETLARRVGAAGDRPLLQAADRAEVRMRRILADRSQLYDELATHRVDTDDRDAASVAEEVVTLWRD